MSDSIKAFNGIAESYENWYRQPRGAQVLKSELLGLESLLPASGIGVEVGAGTGIFAQHLTSDERTVICLEPSTRMTRQIKAKGLHAVLSTAEDVSFKRESLDFAFMVTVLEFLQNPVRALKSIGSSLKRGAPIVVLAINRDSAWGEFYVKLGSSGDPVFRYARIHKREELESFLTSAGFEAIEEIGTLAAGPTEPESEPKLVEVEKGAGAVLIKATKRN